MSLLLFHCTDGVSFFADQQGLSVTREDEIFPAAMRTAEQVMQHLPSISDWSGWLVCVHDELGQMVEVFDFPSLHPAVDAGFTSQYVQGPALRRAGHQQGSSFENADRQSPLRQAMVAC
jgi:hypothetical protein